MVFIAKWLTGNEEVIPGDGEMHAGGRRECEGSVEGRECLPLHTPFTAQGQASPQMC